MSRRHIHHENCRWLVYTRDRDGLVTTHNLTAWVGEAGYDERVEVLRSRLGPDQTLDTTEADAQHRRMRVARRRYDAAMARFMRSSIGLGDYPHPGGLEDWIPA